MLNLSLKILRYVINIGNINFINGVMLTSLMVALLTSLMMVLLTSLMMAMLTSLMETMLTSLIVVLLTSLMVIAFNGAYYQRQLLAASYWLA